MENKNFDKTMGMADLSVAHMFPSKEMLGLSVMQVIKSQQIDLLDIHSKINTLVSNSGKSVPTEEESLDNWIKFNDEIETELWLKDRERPIVEPRRVKSARLHAISEKHKTDIKRKEIRAQVQDKFEASGFIHERKPMQVPGALIPQAVHYLDPTLHIFVEGYLQENLNKIQK